jgi:uncharacterized membrane protein YagU involved in acid resistance
MWLGPALFVTVSVILWKYLGAVFMPELVARSIYRALPALAGMDLFVLINAAIFYFGGYIVVAIFWQRVKAYLRNPFIAGLALWLMNLLIILPLLGRGILGYRMPQGWMSVSLPLLLSHWMFARGLQFQDRRL